MEPDDPQQRPDEEARRLTQLWETAAPRVMAYVRRHVDAETANEVLSETFLVAWRRLDDVPGDALPWLLVVARNTLANHRRSFYRRSLLAYEMQRLAQVAEDHPSAEVAAVESQVLLHALAEPTATAGSAAAYRLGRPYLSAGRHRRWLLHRCLRCPPASRSRPPAPSHGPGR